MIEIRDLKKCYGERTVLDIPALTVKDGEALALAGPNGSGKTTLLRLLSGLLKSSGGTVKKPGKVLYMPQQAYAFKGDLIRNVTLAGCDRSEADRLLEKLELSALAHKKATSLSGGELQRLSLCRVLSVDCELLLLDEPTGACDARGAELVINAIREYRSKTGCTVLISTHSPVLALNAADRLIILNSGRIEADGKPKEILTSPENEWTQHFIAGWKI